MTQQARSKKQKEINVSDVYATVQGTANSQQLVTVYDVLASAGRQFTSIPIGEILGLGNSPINGIQSFNLGAGNDIFNGSSAAIGSSNYIGQRFMYGSCPAGSTTVTLNPSDGINLYGQIPQYDFLNFILYDESNRLEIRQVISDPTDGAGQTIIFEVDAPFNMGADTVFYAFVLNAGLNNLVVGNSNSNSGNNSLIVGSANDIKYVYDAPVENAIVAGFGHIVTKGETLTTGFSGKNDIKGSRVIAGPAIIAIGDCQKYEVMMGARTTDATPTEVLLNSAGRLVIPDNTVWYVTLKYVALYTSATGVAYSNTTYLTLKRVNDLMNLAGSINSETVIKDAGFLGNLTPSIDDPNNSLKLTVTGEAAKTIKWVVSVEILQTTL